MLNSFKRTLRNSPIIGIWLRTTYEWMLGNYVLAQEKKRGVEAEIYDAFDIHREVPLTIMQQWAAIRKNSSDVLDNLPSPNGAPVLFMTVWGGRFSPILSAIESILAMSIRLRGVESISVMCNRVLPACSYDPYGNHALPVPNAYNNGTISPLKCRYCVHSIQAYYRSSPVTLNEFSRFTNPEDLEQAVNLVDGVPQDRYRDFVYHDIAVGEHAFASVLRELGRGTLLDDPYHFWLFRRHLMAAIMVTSVTDRAFAHYQPRRVVVPHGIYVDHGTICEVARKHNVPVAVFSFSYRRDTVMMSHGDTYHRALVTEPTSLWENRPLSADEKRRLEDYIDSKRRGGKDSVTYHPNPIESRDALSQELGLDKSQPVISLFTNVMWDAQVYHTCNAFDNMLDWIYQTIEYFRRRTDLQLVIRIHPAEVKAVKQSKQPVKAEILQRFPDLPDNVKVIGPESNLSSYTLVEISQASLIYGTKMALEIALQGVPVIIAGESFHRGKGISYDVTSAKEYFSLLDRITDLPRNTLDIMSRAQKYGYHFYFRRQIDFPFLTGHVPGYPELLKLTFKSLDNLKPGQFTNLDRICDGLLLGTDFVVD